MDRLEIPGDKLRVRPLLLTSSDISPLDLPDLADAQGSSDFLPGSRDLGYLEGQNIAIEFRWASSVSDMSALARELVEMNVDVILAPASTQLARARCALRAGLVSSWPAPIFLKSVLTGRRTWLQAGPSAIAPHRGCRRDAWRI
jgi:hypothetical protein